VIATEDPITLSQDQGRAPREEGGILYEMLEDQLRIHVRFVSYDGERSKAIER